MKRIAQWMSWFVIATFALGASSVAADDEQRSTPAPAVTLNTGGGAYYSTPCGCVDRGVWSMQWLGRIYFGDAGAVEAGVENGSILLGGGFPTRGWLAGGKLSLLSHDDQRWWDGLSARGGYRWLVVNGTRATGSHSVYGGLNWSVEVLPRLFVETDAAIGRTFRSMSHWSLTGSMGVSFRL